MCRLVAAPLTKPRLTFTWTRAGAADHRFGSEAVASQSAEPAAAAVRPQERPSRGSGRAQLHLRPTISLDCGRRSRQQAAARVQSGRTQGHCARAPAGAAGAAAAAAAAGAQAQASRRRRQRRRPKRPAQESHERMPVASLQRHSRPRLVATAGARCGQLARFRLQCERSARRRLGPCAERRAASSRRPAALWRQNHLVSCRQSEPPTDRPGFASGPASLPLPLPLCAMRSLLQRE